MVDISLRGVEGSRPAEAFVSGSEREQGQALQSAAVRTVYTCVVVHHTASCKTMPGSYRLRCYMCKVQMYLFGVLRFGSAVHSRCMQAFSCSVSTLELQLVMQDRVAQREGDLYRRAQQALKNTIANGSAAMTGALPWEEQQQLAHPQDEHQRRTRERQQQQEQQSEAREAAEQQAAAAERNRRDAAARQVGCRSASHAFGRDIWAGVSVLYTKGDAKVALARETSSQSPRCFAAMPADCVLTVPQSCLSLSGYSGMLPQQFSQGQACQ